MFMREVHLYVAYIPVFVQASSTLTNNKQTIILLNHSQCKYFWQFHSHQLSWDLLSIII